MPSTKTRVPCCRSRSIVVPAQVNAVHSHQASHAIRADSRAPVQVTWCANIPVICVMAKTKTRSRKSSRLLACRPGSASGMDSMAAVVSVTQRW